MGSFHVDLSTADLGERWPGVGGPYCRGSDSVGVSNYAVHDGVYTYGSTSFLQRPCNRLDVADINSKSPTLPGAFLPTMMSLVSEVPVSKGSALNVSCGTESMPGLDAFANCTWSTVAVTSHFVADAEWIRLEVSAPFHLLGY